jgi:hypothetical protein
VARWQDDRPRPHHYEFAHRAFPGIARNPSVDLAALAEARRLDEAMRATWTAIGARRPDEERISADGLHGELVALDSTTALLVTLPTALHAAEAFFVLVAPLEPPASRRYLTLEFSWNPLTGQPTTMLGEWTTVGHLNLGPGPGATRAAFLKRGAEIIGS